MVENKFLFDEWTLLNAINFGNLDNIKWLYANGCEFDKQIYNCALAQAHKKNNHEMTSWLKTNIGIGMRKE